MADDKKKEAPKKSPTELAIERGVTAFVDQHLRNSTFSQDTPAWNHFQAGLPVLIGCIAKELEG